jgi:hypothetical protein
MKTYLSPEPSRRGLLTQVPVNKGGEKTPLSGILEVMEFQTVPVKGSWLRWLQDFPPWRGSVLA